MSAADQVRPQVHTLVQASGPPDLATDMSRTALYGDVRQQLIECGATDERPLLDFALFLMSRLKGRNFTYDVVWDEEERELELMVDEPDGRRFSLLKRADGSYTGFFTDPPRSFKIENYVRHWDDYVVRWLAGQ
jgi:hypothetical protein